MMLTQTAQSNPETCYERRNEGNGLLPALRKSGLQILSDATTCTFPKTLSDSYFSKLLKTQSLQ
jgi:hypothetical protein